MQTIESHKRWLVVLLIALTMGLSSLGAQTLKIAYSDWPGWVAWDVGVKKGFFKEAGVDVQLVWFEYAPSMDAFAAGKVDAVSVTNGDALVIGSSGARNTIILLNDYSNGNDQIIAKSHIKSVKDLKGKKIGVEVGLVDHLLLLKALQMNGLKESDVTIVKMATDQAAQVLASKDIDAVAAWQPNAGAALKAVAGSKAIFTSADVPGLIYDTLVVNPDNLAKNKAAWQKVVNAWYKISAWIKDPKNRKEALEILSARVNLKPEDYAVFFNGTYLLSLDEAKKTLTKSDALSSLYGSTKAVDEFNLANKVYDKSQKPETYIDPSFIMAVK